MFRGLTSSLRRALAVLTSKRRAQPSALRRAAPIAAMLLGVFCLGGLVAALKPWTDPFVDRSAPPNVWLSSLSIPPSLPLGERYSDGPEFRRIPTPVQRRPAEVSPAPVPQDPRRAQIVDSGENATLSPTPRVETALPLAPRPVAVPRTPPETPEVVQDPAPPDATESEPSVALAEGVPMPRPRPEGFAERVRSRASLALARSRLPRERPEAVARLATISLAALDTTAPLAAPALPDPEPLVTASADCGRTHTRAIPRRSRNADAGSDVIAGLMRAGGRARDDALAREILRGNLPEFSRNLVPVTFEGRDQNNRRSVLTICVMPDYLAVGSNRDFVRVPLGLPAAMRIASQFDMILPTTDMVNAIYRQANVRLSPSPMEPGAQMASTGYFLRHNTTVEGQRRHAGGRLGQLVSGHKKDLVLTNRLARNPGRVAIYGWHRRSGHPIQPLSTVHGAYYADYSHGVRLVSRRAYLNGAPIDLRDILGDSVLAGMVSNEGPIRNQRLLAALN